MALAVTWIRDAKSAADEQTRRASAFSSFLEPYTTLVFHSYRIRSELHAVPAAWVVRVLRRPAINMLTRAAALGWVKKEDKRVRLQKLMNLTAV